MGKKAEHGMNAQATALLSEQAAVQHMVGETVMVDTKCSMIYIGRLVNWGDHFVTLADVDVHDVSQGRSNKDMYAVEARKYGVQMNRRSVLIRKAEIVSLSLLKDVIAY